MKCHTFGFAVFMDVIIMTCTLHVFAKREPKARENPHAKVNCLTYNKIMYQSLKS